MGEPPAPSFLLRSSGLVQSSRGILVRMGRVVPRPRAWMGPSEEELLPLWGELRELLMLLELEPEPELASPLPFPSTLGTDPLPLPW